MILISAGHHPEKPGACFESFCEYDEARLWAKTIQMYLGNDNAMLVPFGILKSKVIFINARAKESIAIEIHFNSAMRYSREKEKSIHVGQGSETLYYPGNEVGESAALIVQKHLSEVFGPDRGAKEGWYRMQKKFGPDYFLAKTKCTALIIEPEFIHLKDRIQENREKGCAAISSALLELV